MNPLISRLHSALEFARYISIVERDAAAEREWCKVYGALSAGKPGMTGCILNRAEAQVLRLSVAYALLDRSPEIKVEHQRAALALWDYAEQSVRIIFGDATGNPTADAIMKSLRERGEMDRTEIVNLFSRNQSGPTIQMALELLSKAGLAHCEHVSTGGRPREVWRLGSTN
jgi:DNA replicative helicase MCM subunit Mcm2 (Cdc46/Mcm family)